METIQKNLKTYRNRMRSNKQTALFKFNIGDEIWYYEKKSDHYGKSRFKRTGPHRISRILNSHSIMITGYKNPVNVHRLKPALKRYPYLIWNKDQILPSSSSDYKDLSRREEITRSNVLPLTTRPNTIPQSPNLNSSNQSSSSLQTFVNSDGTYRENDIIFARGRRNKSYKAKLIKFNQQTGNWIATNQLGNKEFGQRISIRPTDIISKSN